MPWQGLYPDLPQVTIIASILLRNYANLNSTFRSELTLPSQEHKYARSTDDLTEYG
jgi:hypothetical protein